MIPLGAALLDPDRRVLHGPDAAVEVAPHVARQQAEQAEQARTPGEVMPYGEILAACYAGAAPRDRAAIRPRRGGTAKAVPRGGDGGARALKVQLHRARRALLQAGAGVDIKTTKRVGLSLDVGGDLVLRAYTPEQAAVADAAVAVLGR